MVGKRGRGMWGHRAKVGALIVFNVADSGTATPTLWVLRDPLLLFLQLLDNRGWTVVRFSDGRGGVSWRRRLLDI